MVCVSIETCIWLTYNIWMISILCVDIHNFDTYCQNSRLVGGPGQYEGMVEVKYNGSWVNICADSFEPIHAFSVCKQLGLPFSKNYQPIYLENVFNANDTGHAITYSSCLGSTEGLLTTCNGIEHITAVKSCCQIASICCYDSSAVDGVCSANWSGTYRRRCHQVYSPRLRYDQMQDTDYMQNSSGKSWTKSAIKIDDNSCVDLNISLPEDIVTRCINNCLQSRSTRIFVSSNGGCDCFVKNEMSNDTECYMWLSVVDRITKQARTWLCIAAEVISGTMILSAEDCSRFLPPFCVENHMVPSQRTLTSTPRTATARHSGTSGSSLLPTLLVTVVVIFVLVALVGMCWLFKKREQKCDRECQNSMSNKTYSTDGIRSSDEEYALISDMELDSGTSVHKPPLPKRGSEISNHGGSKTQGTGTYNKDIVALDEYSTPSDMVVENDMENSTTEYMTTYDDPFRHTLKRGLQNTHSAESKAVETHETNIAETKDMENKTNSKAIATRNTQISTSHSCKCHKGTTAEMNTDIDRNKSETIKDIQSVKSSDVLSKQISNQRTDDNFEHFKTYVANATKDITNDANKHEDADYEDTNIIDGIFPTKCVSKRTPEEHVCLDCLEPEHLKELGIKIISDQSGYELENRLSDSFVKKYNSGESLSSLIRCKSDAKGTDEILVCNYSDKTNIDVEQTISTVNDTDDRTCNICNTAYDRLGTVKRTLQAGSTESRNVYDKFTV